MKKDNREECEVWRDIIGLKDRLESLRETDIRMRKLYEPNSVEHRHFNGRLAAIDEVLDFIDELDEPEVLSKEWIGSNSVNASHDGVTEEYVHVDDLKNLIIPKQDLPVIPKYVADWIKGNKEWYDNIFFIGYDICNNDIQPDVDDWIMANEEEFVRAWLEGYEVEEESLYYALVKGHELVTDEGDIACKYWNLRVPTGDVLPSNRYSRRGEFVVKMSKSEWNKLGINDSNADFVEVAE